MLIPVAAVGAAVAVVWTFVPKLKPPKPLEAEVAAGTAVGTAVGTAAGTAAGTAVGTAAGATTGWAWVWAPKVKPPPAGAAGVL